MEVRKRLVAAYVSGKVSTYAEAAEVFGVGLATVSRLLRKHREGGDLSPKQIGGYRRYVIEDSWLRSHAKKFPDATLQERVSAWQKHSGVEVHLSTMGHAMKRIGWTHKKRHP